MIQAGRFRHKIIVEQRDTTAVAGGIPDRQWVTLFGDVPCMVEPMPSSDIEQGEIREGESRFKITTRYRDGYNNKLRVRWRDRILYIARFENIASANRELTIIADAPDFETVTYRRGNVETQLPAIRDKSTFVDSGGETAVTGNSVDWLIDAADLRIAGHNVTPHVGDRIVTADYVTFAAQMYSRDLWRYDDPHRTFIRCHSIEVAA